MGPARPRNAHTMMVPLSKTEKVTFWRILARHVRPRASVSWSFPRSSEKSTTSAVSIATGVPAAPMAMPMSAAARAGASFTPSPTMPRVGLQGPHVAREGPSGWYRRWPHTRSARRSPKWASLSAGASPAKTFARPSPTAAATRRAAPSLSPVSMVARTPALRRPATSSGAPRRTESATASAPNSRRRAPTHTTVCPLRSQAAALVPSGPSRGHPTSPASFRLPTRRAWPSTEAATPRPSRVSYSSTSSLGATPRAAASASTAAASGWEDCASTLASQNSNSASVRPGVTATSRTLYRPSVSVPVLSRASEPSRPSASRYCPPLISTPLLAAAARPLTTVAGVERTSAHGHPSTSSTQASLSHSSRSAAPPARLVGMMAISAAATMTTGV